MGSRKNKSKKNTPTPPIAPLDDADNEQLMDDLLAQLDSQDKTVQQESAAVLNEMQISQIANEESNKKNSSRDRFKERQVRVFLSLSCCTEEIEPDRNL